MVTTDSPRTLTMFPVVNNRGGKEKKEKKQKPGQNPILRLEGTVCAVSTGCTLHRVPWHMEVWEEEGPATEV